MNNIQNIYNYTPKSEDVFIFDTNVLIKIFYNTLGSRNSAPYINFYGKVLKSKFKLLLSSIQLSEFVNRCIRFQFDLYKESHPNIQSFKEDYRDTKDYKDCMEAIISIVENDIYSSFVCSGIFCMQLYVVHTHQNKGKSGIRF